MNPQTPCMHHRLIPPYRFFLAALLGIVQTLSLAVAGPPFKTDDPEPVGFGHWEFYTASVQQFAGGDISATLPHIEVNYGVLPNVQLHVIAPLGYSRIAGTSHYGFSDTELGMKYRFIQESETAPQAGIFPLIEIPTGSSRDNLGNGDIQLFLPVWLQKSWGPVTTYGGGGYWYHPGTGHRNWLYAGWEIQVDISETVTLGGEAYYQTADEADTGNDGGTDLGGYFNLNEHNHILWSAGRNMRSGPVISGYLGYQYTI